MSKEVKAWMDSMGIIHKTEEDADTEDANYILRELNGAIGESSGAIGEKININVYSIAKCIDAFNMIAALINKHDWEDDDE